MSRCLTGLITVLTLAIFAPRADATVLFSASGGGLSAQASFEITTQGNKTYLNILLSNTDTANGGPNRSFNGTGGGSATAATNPFFRRVGSGTSLAQGAGRFGSLGRNVFHGPGDINFDVTMMKRTKIGESKILEFRAEFFNIFNHVNFGNPNGNIGSVNFGRITTTDDPRLIQFGLKFHF